MLTRITDRKIPCVYIHVYRIKKNWGPGLYNCLRHADNRRYFSGLSLTWNQREAHKCYLAREVGKCSCWEKGNFIMINEFKYGLTWKIWPSLFNLSLYNAFKSMIFDLVSYKILLLISVGKLYYLKMKHQIINVRQISLFPIRFKMLKQGSHFWLCLPSCKSPLPPIKSVNCPSIAPPYPLLLGSPP